MRIAHICGLAFCDYAGGGTKQHNFWLLKAQRPAWTVSAVE
jgi:hypothetical protein